MASMPHLSQLQRDYRDKNVTIIGMTSPDESNTLEAVKAMVEEKGDGMDYAVAFDVERKTNEAWMKAANQRGIPTSFLVDKAGKIAWIGHPSSADIPLSQVVAGTWDPVEGPALMKRINKERMAIYETEDPRKALELLEKFKADYPMAATGLDSLQFSILTKLPDQVAAATALGNKLIDKAIEGKDAMALNGLAWGLVDPAVKLENRFLDLAQRAADKANELTEEKNGPILDTVARVHFWRGDLEQALAVQKRAVEMSEGPMKESLKEALAEYEKAVLKKEAVQ